MTESFNLNNFLQEYKTYNNRQYTAAENAQEEMERTDIARAAGAVGNTVKNKDLLELTLGQKIGIGEHVVQQIGETAANVVKGVVRPLTEYLNKYEKVFDQEEFTQQFQEYAKQMFYSREALAKEASKGAYIVGLDQVDKNGNAAATATKFFYTM